MSLIQNERTKLLATALNNTAVATLVTAVIAPTAGLLNGSPPVTWVWWALLEVTWFLVGLGLHLAAQAVLGRLKS